MNFKILSLALLVSGSAMAGQMSDNANVGWVEAQCVAVAHLDSDSYNAQKAEQLAARAKARLTDYYDQVKSQTLEFDEAQKIGGNLSKLVPLARNRDDFYYTVVQAYTGKIQEEKSRAHYQPDAVEYDYYYSLRWVNSGCDALLALDK